MFIVDFDDTLLDTQAYKEKRMAELEKIGVSRKIYKETYQQVYYSYTHESHARALAEKGFSFEIVLEILNKCLAEVAQFVFPDAQDFLEFFKKYHQPMVLLSFGVKEIQEFKLRALGFEKYFDKVITTVGMKGSILDELNVAGRNDVWFINDKVGETLKVKADFPNLKFILKKCCAYPEEDYIKTGLPYFKTLREIQEYVAKHC